MDYGPVRTEIWLREADAGRITIYGQITGDHSRMIRDYLLHLIRSGAEGRDLDFFIDCDGSDYVCWPIACCILKLSQENATTAYIEEAKSGGLILAVAATKRVCSPRAEFMWHGSRWKEGYDESKMNDEERVEWMVARLTKPGMFERSAVRECWAEKAVSGKRFCFEAEEALELGVVHEIATKANLFDFPIETPIPHSPGEIK